MRELGLKLCLFLFLVVVFAGRTSELGAITGAVTGAILLWPLYRKLVAAPDARSQQGTVSSREPGGAP